MTTAELLAALAREYPNGVSFDPMAVRLLRQKAPFEDWQIEKLKAVMFQLKSGLWFSREMVSDEKSKLAFEGQAREWLMKYGCFSVERLFRDFCGVLRPVVTSEDCAAFLRYLSFTVTAWGKGGYFCSHPSDSLDDRLAAISEMIAGWIEEAGGTLTFNKIEQALPHLTAEALESIRAQLLPEVYVVEIAGMLCWCNTEALPLPEDFSEKLTTIVDTLVELKEKITSAKLEFALNLFYRIRLREEFALLDNGTFMHICAKHYQGENNVFPNMKESRERANDLSNQSKRVRRPNTRFSNLGVPIGAKLVFTKHRHLSCVVLDDVNKVEYEGKAWSISSLAGYWLSVPSLNGFCYFSYEGEILWERRLRLERTDKRNEYQTATILPATEVQEMEGTMNV